MNNKLVNVSVNVTMDSREIAELTGKQHKNVLSDIRKQLDEQGIGRLKYEQSYMNSQNKSQPCYRLNKKQTLILISGYSMPLRAKIIDRLEYLENQNKPEPPTQLQLAEQVVELLKQQEIDKPKIDYANAITGTINPCSIREWVNSLKSDLGLQAGERQVIKYLIEKKYVYRDKKNNLRHFSGREELFSLVPIVVATSKGNKEYFQLKITGQGQLLIGDKVVKHFNK